MKNLVNQNLNEFLFEAKTTKKTKFINERKSEIKPKEFWNILRSLGDSLTFLSETDTPELWFLQENPKIKEIVEKMVDLDFELGNALADIDYGRTDYLTMKNWHWNDKQNKE